MLVVFGTRTLLCLLNYFDQPPPLPLTDWPGLHYFHGITDAGFPFFVMSHQRGSLLVVFLIERVRNLSFQGHHDALLHFVADDLADADFALIATDGGDC